MWTIVGFQQRDRQDSLNFNNDTFHISSATSAQFIIGTEKYPDNGILLNFDNNLYSPGYGQIKSFVEI